MRHARSWRGLGLFWAAFLLAMAPVSVLARGSGAPPAGQVERWKAIVELGPATIEMQIDFSRAGDGAWSATIDIPLQGVAQEALRDVAYGDDAIAFTFQPAGSSASAAFTLTRAGDSATGTLEQAGQSLPVHMQRLKPGESVAGPRRPQTPKPPFPYISKDVSVDGDGGARLAGSLVLPPGDGPFPAALFISGSGPQDRDETLAAHKPFLVIADALARAGVASLRLDDRGVGGSDGRLRDATVQILAADAAKALEFLRARPEIDPSRVGIIGHSEGGLIGPMTAAAMPDAVAFLALIAGPALPGDAILSMQLEALLHAYGAPEDIIETQLAAQGAFLEAIKSNRPESERRAALRKLIIAQTSGVEPQSDEARAALDQQVEAQARVWDSQWFRSFLAFDPRESLRKTTCPVLALNGSLDVQVPAEANLSAMERALREAGNARFETAELPGLNHLLQPARRGTPDEYAAIETTIDPTALSRIVDWIVATTASPSHAP